MNILIIKTIFAKDKNFIDVNITSIKSFLNYISDNKNKITFKLFGWIYNNEDNFLKELNVCYELFNENYGKMYLLKNIKKYISNYEDYDFILYADHDISIIDTNILENIEINNIVNNKKIIMCSFNQEPNNRHSQIVYSNEIIINKNKYYYHENNSFIATGCFIVKPYFFKYLENIIITQNYGTEDIYIGKIINDNNFISLLSEKKVYHPFDINKEYEEWKIKQIYKLYNF